MAETVRVDAFLFWRMRSLLEAITENDWDDGAGDAVTCGMVWTKEARDLLAAHAAWLASNKPTKGGPTEQFPDAPYCKPDGSCCDFCCGN